MDLDKLKEIPLLVVEDNKDVHENILQFLQRNFNTIYSAYDGHEGLEIFRKKKPQIVLSDIRMPGLDGLGMAACIKKIKPDTPIIILSAFYETDLLIRSIDIGIDKFVRKPVNGEKLLDAISKSALPLMQKEEIISLNERIVSSIESRLSRSQAMKDVLHGIEKVAKSDFSVIISGETGVGKSYIANLIHTLSRRSSNPFITVDIGTIPETLVESELFGHTKGAFTGADRVKKGFFEIADGGTLFLEELENMTPYVQSKLLRVVEEKRICPVGSTTMIDVDIRIIGATNKDLFQEVKENKFREDLYYRLCEFDIDVPPLRKRPEDIRWLTEKFVNEVAYELEKTISEISADAMAMMESHPWKGNVREMKNALRRMVLMCDENRINAEDVQRILKVDPSQQVSNAAGTMGFTLSEAVAEAEKTAIIKALKGTKGKKVKAASVLGIDYKTLVTKMTKFNLA